VQLKISQLHFIINSNIIHINLFAFIVNLSVSIEIAKIRHNNILLRPNTSDKVSRYTQIRCRKKNNKFRNLREHGRNIESLFCQFWHNNNYHYYKLGAKCEMEKFLNRKEKFRNCRLVEIVVATGEAIQNQFDALFID
jgi:hypothetical protein